MTNARPFWPSARIVHMLTYCACMQLGLVACGLLMSACNSRSASGKRMVVQIRTTRRAHAEHRVADKSHQYSDDNPWLLPRLHDRNRLACAWPVSIGMRHWPWPPLPSLHVLLHFGIRLTTLSAASPR